MIVDHCSLLRFWPDHLLCISTVWTPMMMTAVTSRINRQLPNLALQESWRRRMNVLVSVRWQPASFAWRGFARSILCGLNWSSIWGACIVASSFAAKKVGDPLQDHLVEATSWYCPTATLGRGSQTLVTSWATWADHRMGLHDRLVGDFAPMQVPMSTSVLIRIRISTGRTVPILVAILII